MKKKIVHVGKYYPPDMGGIESVTRVLTDGSIATGHKVTVVCFDKSGVSNKDGDFPYVRRFPVNKMLNSQPLGFAYFWNAIKWARKSDIVHLHTPNLLASLASLFVGRRAKLLVHWHSDIVGKGKLGDLVRPLENYLLRRADVIVATSPPYVEGSKILLKYAGKVKVVPLGIEAPVDAGIKSEIPERLNGFIRGRRIVLSVGRLIGYKGFSYLIDAAKLLPDDTVVVIVGNGPLHGGLTQQIVDLGLQDKVLLAGRASDQELAALYQNSSLYCMPSIERSEAFGVVLMEAMAYGLPIVATSIPGSGVPWVNQDQVTGLNVPPEDAFALAKACKKILEDHTLSARFSHGAANRFQQEFRAEIFCSRMDAIYCGMN